jgi:hypothetical protein
MVIRRSPSLIAEENPDLRIRVVPGGGLSLEGWHALRPAAAAAAAAAGSPPPPAVGRVMVRLEYRGPALSTPR